jgi:L-fuconolactonase
VDTVDTHCHVGLDWFEPVEVLLFQMERNGVDRAVLIQTNKEYDNSYILQCADTYPGRFAAVGAVDGCGSGAADALDDLADQGLQGIRFSLIDLTDDAPDPVPFLQHAASLGMKISVLGLHHHFAAPEFEKLIQQLPDLPMIIEHLGFVTTTNTDSIASFERVLDLARHPNVYAKVPGLGELLPRPAPMRHPSFDVDDVPPFIDQAIDAFGADRLMIGTDSPVCSYREGYANVVGNLRAVLGRRSPAERDAILGGTASALFAF